MTRTAFAAAKVNLYLHVAAPTPDGYHPIASLMAFADVGDTVRGTPAEALSLTIEGPFGDGLSAGPDNLVLRAAEALLERAVALEPVNPEINDHLGDAYWRAGRKTEAQYQWSRVLGLMPTPDLKTSVERKLNTGLDPVAPAVALR